MKYLVVILIILLSFSSKAQQRFPTGFPTQANTGWNKWGYAMSDSGLIIANRDTTWMPKYSGTVVFRPGDKQFYWFDSTILTWHLLGPNIDTTSLSNRINLKLNISDTVTAWLAQSSRLVDSMYRVNDSTVGYTIKGNPYTFQILGRSSGGGGGPGTVTSVALSMPSAFSVTGSPITGSGTFAVSGAGITSQYIRGNGTLATTDTGMIPNFHLKVRSLFSGSSPITYNSTTGVIGIGNANTSGAKGAATFLSSDFSDNGSGLISLSTLVSSGACTNCAVTFGADGRATAYANGTGPTGASVDTIYRTPGVDSIYYTINSVVRAIKDSVGAGGSFSNNNVGGGFRWVKTPAGNIATAFGSNTIIIDSSSNSNGLTFKADTSVLATSFDISTKLNSSDTTNKWVNNIRRVSGGISVEVFKNGSWTAAYTDSVGTGATLNNIGTGFALAATPSGNIKRVANSNTVLWDSTSTANSLTAKADTATIATKYYVNRGGVTYPFENPFGLIYESRYWDGGTMAGEFTNSGGPTLALNGIYPRSTNSTIAWTAFHRFLPYRPTLLPKWSFTVEYQIVSALASNIGFGPAIRSNNVAGANYGYGSYLLCSSSTATPHLAKQDGTSDQSGSTFTVSQGDVIRMVLSFDDSVLTLTSQNITTSSSVSTITKSFVAGSAPYVPNTGTMGFQNFSGTYEIRYIKFTSDAVSSPTLVVAADSKGQINSTTFGGRFPSQLNSNYPTVLQYSGGGDQLTDFIDKKEEVMKLNPEQLWILLGSNDIRYGWPLQTVMNRVRIIKSWFSGTSTRVYWSVIPEDSTAGGVGLSDFNAALSAETGGDYIDLWTPMSTSNILKAIYNSGDGVHLNQLGQDEVHSVAVASGTITTQSPNRRSPYQNFGGGIAPIGDSLTTLYKLIRGANVINRFDDSLNSVPSFIANDVTNVMISSNLTQATHFNTALLDVDGAIAVGGVGAAVFFRERVPGSFDYFGLHTQNSIFNFSYNGVNYATVNSGGKWKIGDDQPAQFKSALHIQKSYSTQNQNGGGFGLNIDTATYTVATGGYLLYSNASIATSNIVAASSSGYVDATTLYVGSAPVAGANVSITRAWSLYLEGKTRLGSTDSVGTATGGYLFKDATTGEVKITQGASGSGITTLNTLTASTQTFATGTSGTDFNIGSVTSTHTFNIPSASTVNRGLVTIAAQSFAGVKEFTNAVDITDVSRKGKLIINGDMSMATAPGIGGLGLILSTFTYTDGAGAGTDANGQYAHKINLPTFSSTNSRTYSGNTATMFVVGAPVASGSLTISHPYALYSQDMNYLEGVSMGISEASTNLSISDETHNIYTGTGGDTFTLPTLSKYRGVIYHIKNAGSGNLTVSRSGSDNIYDTSSVTSITMAAGSARIFVGASTFWYVE